ncbi:MAG: hypothetical protein KA164_08025 [Rhodoferax sp.]|nr:hypothetical protein [Rhodoferax sp.]
MVAPAALADPGYYVVSVYESEGVARADFRYWTVKLKGSSTVIWPEIAVGYGVNKRWYTQVLASYIGSADSATRPSNLQWQNDFLLTQGQFDVDLALHTLLVRYYDNGGNALEFGPAMQTEWGRMRFNANLILERPWGLARPRPTQFKYQWQAVYRWRPQLQFGLQGFGELGEWDNWAASASRSQRVGPVIQGAFASTQTSGWHYQLAYLDGKIYGKRGHMLSARIHYEF